MVAVGDSPISFVRTLTIKAPWNGYEDLSEIIGTEYTVVFWHDPATNVSSVKVASESIVSSNTNVSSRATTVTLSVADAHTEKGVTLQLTHDSSTQ